MKITTRRLILQNFQLEDLDQLAPIMADPKGMRFSRTGHCLSVLETKEKIKSFIASYEKFGFGKWAVSSREHNQLIGYCGIAMETIDGKDEKELGYRLDSRFWNQGLATEAAKAATQYAFERFKILYILGIVDRKNKASLRVLEKLGMKYAKDTRFHGAEMAVYSLERAASSIN